MHTLINQGAGGSAAVCRRVCRCRMAAVLSAITRLRAKVKSQNKSADAFSTVHDRGKCFGKNIYKNEKKRRKYKMTTMDYGLRAKHHYIFIYIKKIIKNFT